LTSCDFQIKKLRRLNDGSMNVVARGRQRFRIRKAWTAADGAVRTFFYLCSNRVRNINVSPSTGSLLSFQMTDRFIRFEVLNGREKV
jgi:hypothetical protein